MRCFTSQSVIEMIEVTSSRETAADDAGHTIDAHDFFVQTSAMLQNQFKPKMQRNLTSRKKLTKDSYFWLMQYASLFALKSRNRSSKLDAKKRQHRTEAYEKLYKLPSCGMRGTTWAQTVKFNEIRAEGFFVCGREAKNISARDHLFVPEPAENAFKIF